MKLRFKHQKFQADAAKAIVDVFQGQPYQSGISYLIDETPPAYAGGIILGQAKLVLNLRVPDILYSVVSLPH